MKTLWSSFVENDKLTVRNFCRPNRNETIKQEIRVYFGLIFSSTPIFSRPKRKHTQCVCVLDAKNLKLYVLNQVGIKFKK